MRMTDAGGLMQGAAQASNLQISYDYTQAGSDNLTVPAGTFSCTRYDGTGHATMNVVFKTMEVHSEVTTCIADNVPFGIVQATSENVIDGRSQTSETKLINFGTSGASSAITGEPVEMPSIGNIFGSR